MNNETIEETKDFLRKNFENIEEFKPSSSSTNFVGVEIKIRNSSSICVVMKRSQFYHFNLRKFFGVYRVCGLGYYEFIRD